MTLTPRHPEAFYRYSRKISDRDRRLVVESRFDSQPRETFEYRINGKNSNELLEAGDLIAGTAEEISSPALLLNLGATLPDRVQQLGTQVSGVELIHTHPYEAIEVTGEGPETGILYAQPSAEDIGFCAQVQSFLPVPVTLSVLIGLRESQLTKISLVMPAHLRSH